MSRAQGRLGVRAALTFWGIGALLGVAFAILYVAAQPLLLAFAALLFGTALRGLAEQLARRLRCSVGVALVLCVVAGIGLGVAAALWIVPQASEQFAILADHLLRAYEELRARASRSELGRRLIEAGGSLEHPMQYLGRAAGLLASAAGALGAAVFVVFVTIYVAASPEVYRRGLLRLAPPRRRARLAAVLDLQAGALRRWMLGRLVSMTAVGVATSLGLWLLGIPLPAALGMLAGLLGFVPNLGPIASALPALLLAATVDIPHVGYVLALYVGINLADGYLLTPAIERHAVSLPPALVIFAQLVFGAFWGLLGLALAVPLLACLTVGIRELYVRDVLEAKGRGEPAPDPSTGAPPATGGAACRDEAEPAPQGRLGTPSDRPT